MARKGKLYHATAASRLPSIKRKGLSPEEAGRWIYLAADEGHAAGYAAFFPGKPVALLEVDVTKLDPDLLGPDDMDLPDLLDQRGEDPHDWKNYDWRDSLAISGQATYDGVIPPEAVKVVRRWMSPKYT